MADIKPAEISAIIKKQLTWVADARTPHFHEVGTVLTSRGWDFQSLWPYQMFNTAN